MKKLILIWGMIITGGYVSAQGHYLSLNDAAYKNETPLGETQCKKIKKYIESALQDVDGQIKNIGKVPGLNALKGLGIDFSGIDILKSCECKEIPQKKDTKKTSPNSSTNQGGTLTRFVNGKSPKATNGNLEKEYGKTNTGESTMVYDPTEGTLTGRFGTVNRKGNTIVVKGGTGIKNTVNAAKEKAEAQQKRIKDTNIKAKNVEDDNKAMEDTLKKVPSLTPDDEKVVNLQATPQKPQAIPQKPKTLDEEEVAAKKRLSDANERKKLLIKLCNEYGIKSISNQNESQH
jgi:hypothetical protein